ncbi:MAG: lipid A biosynthesis acyltransferase [Moraxellaceae bacterium]|nr:MAG: lipid A biosynthesis acyltransferase [Moraxellaceae bacterium]
MMVQDPAPAVTGLSRILAIFSRLPLALLQGLARLVARLLGSLSSAKALKTVRRNLQIAFPELSPEQHQQLAKQSVQAQFQSMLEFVKVWGSPPQFSIDQIHQVQGQELLTEAIGSKQGLILVLPHFGSWEIMNAWLNQFTALVIMYKPSQNPALDQFVLKARSRLQATLVPTNESGVRQIFRALKQGGVTAILPDHTPETSGGIYSRFFGCPVLTSTLVSRLAQKTQCHVLQLSCMRQPNHAGFCITIEPVDPRIHSADLQQSVDALNQSIEQLVRRHPVHYHWSYKRFKANPLLENIYYVADKQIAPTVAKAQQADSPSP